MFYDSKTSKKISVEILELGVKTGEANASPTSSLSTALIYANIHTYIQTEDRHTFMCMGA